MTIQSINDIQIGHFYVMDEVREVLIIENEGELKRIKEEFVYYPKALLGVFDRKDQATRCLNKMLKERKLKKKI